MSVEKYAEGFSNPEKAPYSILANIALQNVKIPEALAIWVYLQSLPPDWNINKIHLRRHFSISEKKMNLCLAVLKKCNLLEYVRPRNENGEFGKGYYRALCGSKFNQSEVDETYSTTMVKIDSCGDRHEWEKGVHTKEIENTKKINKTNILSSSRKTLSSTTPIVKEIFEYWQEVLNHHGSKLDQNRKTHIERALKLGYDKFDCFLSIRGCKASEWHMGNNPQNRKYDDLGLIFRNAEKIEKFINQSGLFIPREAKDPKTAFQACLDDEEPAGVLFVIKERIKAKFDGEWNKFVELDGNKQWVAFESIYKHSLAQVMPVGNKR